MKRLRIIIFALSLVFQLAAQGVDTAFIYQITQHREEYKTHFLTDPRSPLRAKDTAYLDFYAPDPAWHISARLTLTPEAAPFDALPPTSTAETTCTLLCKVPTTTRRLLARG